MSEERGNDEQGMDASLVIRAAQQQIESLQAEVRAGRKAARLTKVQVRILGAVCALLIAVTAIVGAALGQQANLSDRLRTQVTQSCQTGNTQRAQEVKVWDSFIDLLLQGNTNPKAASEGAEFKQFVAQVYAPRNCQQAYSAAALDGGE